MKIRETLVVRELIERKSSYKKAQATDKELSEMASKLLETNISTLSIARLRKAMGITCLKEKRVSKPKKMSRLEILENKIAELAKLIEDAFGMDKIEFSSNGHNRLEEVVGVR